MIEQLFRFPTVMIDIDNEDGRRKLSLPGSDDAEYVIGYSEYPVYDFIGISDRWLPTKESFEKARDENIFEACAVTFANVGTFLVPWARSKFKSEMNKFIKLIKKPEDGNVTILITDKNSLKKITGDKNDNIEQE